MMNIFVFNLKPTHSRICYAFIFGSEAWDQITLHLYYQSPEIYDIVK